MPIDRLHGRFVALLLLSLGLSFACSSQPEPSATVERVGRNLTTCVTVRRGVFGSVADSTMWQINTVQRAGSWTPLRTGASSTGPVFVVMRFDLSSIPPNSKIESADLTLYRNSGLLASDPAALLSIYRVTAPWIEADINYANFMNAYDGSTVWSTMNVAGYGFKSTSVTGLVQAWINGTPNHGFYLRQPITPDTTYPSSEHPDVARRPGLTICYSDQAPAADGGAGDGSPSVADASDPPDAAASSPDASSSVDAAPALDTAPEADAATGPVSGCLTIRRGALGDVADTTILQTLPSQTNGALNPIRTGTSSTGFLRSMLRFDLGVLPAGATITSATMTVYAASSLASSDPRALVRVHRATQPWSEATATWASFGGGLAFEATPSASFNVAGYGFKSVNVTALAQSWTTLGNNGLVLNQDDAPSTTYSSSEHPTVDRRPALAVCYASGSPPADAAPPSPDTAPASLDTSPTIEVDTALPADAVVEADTAPPTDTMVEVDAELPVDVMSVSPPDAEVDTAPVTDPTGDPCVGRSQPRLPRPLPSEPLVYAPVGSSLTSLIASAPVGASILIEAGSFGSFSTGGKTVSLFGGYCSDFAQRGCGTTEIAGSVIVSGTGRAVFDGLTIRGGARAIDAQGTWGSQASLSLYAVRVTGGGQAVAYGQWGGALYARNIALTVSESTIDSNQGGNGGAFNVSSPQTVRIYDTIFEDNDSWGDHGGAAWFGSSARLVCNTWRRNSIGLHVGGGGWGAHFVAVAGTVDSDHSTYTQGIAAVRGAVFFDEGVTGSVRFDNIADNTVHPTRGQGGSGLYVDGGSGIHATVTVEDSTITGNSGPGVDGGRCVFVTRNSAVTMRRTTCHNGDDFYVRVETGDNSSLTLQQVTSDEAQNGPGIVVLP